MQMFNIPVQTTRGLVTIGLVPGQTLFVVGANGAGKSSLLQRVAQNTQGISKRISATRQTWLNQNGLEFAPSQKAQFEQQARNWDANQQSRFAEQNANLRTSLTLYDLIDAENHDSRVIADALRQGQSQRATELAQKAAPITTINSLLVQSNLPITISINASGEVVASKRGSAPFRAAELSDGERNALLIAADVLTAKSGTLLIIDEPERHLHRSIISPLLTHLFRARPDCAFAVATHDLMLPMDNPEAQVLLIRSCTYMGSTVISWDVDLLSPNIDIDDKVKQDIMGARRRIVFVEGDESSLDAPLYSILFPDISIRVKGSSRSVEQAVAGLRSSGHAHWVQAFGIIDNDGRDEASVASLQTAGVFSLPFYSIESIYFHPDIIRLLAQRYTSAVGGDGESIAHCAITAAVAAVHPHLGRLAASAVEKTVRRQIFAELPTLRDIQQQTPIAINIDTASVVAVETAALEAAVASSDWVYIVKRCPVRTTPAPDEIVRAIGLRNRGQYETAVLQLLRENPAALDLARSFFGPLRAELSI